MADRPAILQPTPTELVGDRIIVHAYRDSDARVVHTAVEESRDHLRPWLLWYSSHQSVDDTLAYIRRTQAEYVLHEAFEMGIFTLFERYLGGCALHAGDWEIPAFTIGYWIRKGGEGKGYVTEAVRG